VEIYAPGNISSKGNPNKHAGHYDTYKKNLVVTGSDDKTAAVWDLMTGELICHLKGAHKWYVTSISIYMPTYGTSPFVVTGGWDPYCVVWNVATQSKVLRIENVHSSATAVLTSFVSPQLSLVLGRDPLEAERVPFILVCGVDRCITVYDGETGAALRSTHGGHTDYISCVDIFVPPAAEWGLYMLTGSYDHSAIVWDLLTGELVRHLRGGHSDWVTSVAIFRSNSGRFLLLVCHMNILSCADCELPVIVL
jgi:WD40 repeat protein